MDEPRIDFIMELGKLSIFSPSYGFLTMSQIYKHDLLFFKNWVIKYELSRLEIGKFGL